MRIELWLSKITHNKSQEQVFEEKIVHALVYSEYADLPVH